MANTHRLNVVSAPQEEVTSGASLSGVLIGALIALAIQVAMGLLGLAIGLVGFDPTTGRWSGKWAAIGGGGWLALTVIVSFFVGGFAASRVSRQTAKSGAQWHALGVWSLLEVAYVFFLGSALTAAGGLLFKAGATAGVAAGVSGSADQVKDQVSRYLSEVRIVTDMSVMKGKAVTQFELPKDNGKKQSAGSAAREGKKEIEKQRRQIGVSEPQLREAAGDIRKVAAGITWPAFGAMVLSGLSSLGGGMAARRRTLREAEPPTYEATRSGIGAQMRR